MVTYWISQILVVVAYLLVGFGMRREKRIEILIYSCMYQILMMGQYILLAGYAGAISSMIGLTRNIIFIINERRRVKNSKSILVFFSILIIMFTVLFYTSFVDIFPCIFAIIGLYVYWSTNMKVVRLGNIAISVCYIIYAISLNSWFSIICEMYFIVNTIIGHIKYECKKRSETS